MVLPALLEADAKDEQSNLGDTRTPPCTFVCSIRSPQINCRYVLKMNELNSLTASRGPSSPATASSTRSQLVGEVLC